MESKFNCMKPNTQYKWTNGLFMLLKKAIDLSCSVSAFFSLTASLEIDMILHSLQQLSLNGKII